MPSPPKPYIIDANTFMEAARGYYAFDIAQPFWDALPDFARRKRIISLDKVLDEINRGDDELKRWANSEFNTYFADSQTSDVVQAYADLVNWADQHPTYLQMAKDEFMEDDNADAWIIAYAKARDCTVVTDELSNPHSKKRIIIPDVCIAFGVPYCDVFTMLRALNFSFTS
jgi:hypothetical protein